MFCMTIVTIKVSQGETNTIRIVLANVTNGRFLFLIISDQLRENFGIFEAKIAEVQSDLRL
jgi:hypothetical protein